MNSKKLMLMVWMVSLCARVFGQAPATEDVQVLDQVCVAEEAKRCFEAAAPSTTNGFNHCQPGYVPDYQRKTCARVPVQNDPTTLYPILQACELDAHVHYPPACVKIIHVDELMTTLRDDMRKLLSDFCKTYTADADKKKCDSMNGGAAPAATKN
jgi:hypothetical protein